MFINDEVQKQVLPILAKSTVTPTVEAQERAGGQLQLNPGQQVKAEILANLPNNLYLARIAGEMFKLEIPLNVQPGETLEMTFVSADPRVTFQVNRPDQGASVSLSSLGKWLSGVVRDAPALPVEQGVLLDSPTQAAALLGERLKAAVTESGLFYESYLAQWAAGGLALGEILKEPQGKLSRALRGSSQPEEAEVPEGAGFADSSTLSLVKEQLLLFHSGVLNWQGEAWPGQGMQVAFTRHEDEGEEELVEANLSLALPHLGAIESKLRFTPSGLFVEFVCDRSGSAAVLEEAGGELRSALAAIGLHLTRMVAKDDETEP